MNDVAICAYNLTNGKNALAEQKIGVVNRFIAPPGRRRMHHRRGGLFFASLRALPAWAPLRGSRARGWSSHS